ncbi:hypothetical protein BGY98DRAFT_1075680, partial [Russula aff. rugulosa BPL654]
APPPEVRVYLRDLASAANSTANENACGSVLAGQTSEADEFGDICVWLGTGAYSEGHEVNILRVLNLSDSTRQALEFANIAAVTFKVLNSNEFTKLSVLLAKLQNKFYFRADSGPSADGTVIHLLVGHLAEGVLSGWVALVGIGISL